MCSSDVKILIVLTTTYLGIIMHISHPAKVGLVVLRLEPTAQSLDGWSYAPSLLRRGSALSFLFQPLRDEDLAFVVACLTLFFALCTSVDLPGLPLTVTTFAGFDISVTFLSFLS